MHDVELDPAMRMTASPLGIQHHLRHNSISICRAKGQENSATRGRPGARCTAIGIEWCPPTTVTERRRQTRIGDVFSGYW
jgi:hypothetical protein